MTLDRAGLGSQWRIVQGDPQFGCLLEGRNRLGLMDPHAAPTWVFRANGADIDRWSGACLESALRTGRVSPAFSSSATVAWVNRGVVAGTAKWLRRGALPLAALIAPSFSEGARILLGTLPLALVEWPP